MNTKKNKTVDKVAKPCRAKIFIKRRCDARTYSCWKKLKYIHRKEAWTLRSSLFWHFSSFAREHIQGFQKFNRIFGKRKNIWSIITKLCFVLYGICFDDVQHPLAKYEIYLTFSKSYGVSIKWLNRAVLKFL